MKDGNDGVDDVPSRDVDDDDRSSGDDDDGNDSDDDSDVSDDSDDDVTDPNSSSSSSSSSSFVGYDSPSYPSSSYDDDDDIMSSGRDETDGAVDESDSDDEDDDHEDDSDIVPRPEDAPSPSSHVGGWYGGGGGPVGMMMDRRRRRRRDDVIVDTCGYGGGVGVGVGGSNVNEDGHGGTIRRRRRRVVVGGGGLVGDDAGRDVDSSSIRDDDDDRGGDRRRGGRRRRRRWLGGMGGHDANDGNDESSSSSSSSSPSSRGGHRRRRRGGGGRIGNDGGGGGTKRGGSMYEIARIRARRLGVLAVLFLLPSGGRRRRFARRYHVENDEHSPSRRIGRVRRILRREGEGGVRRRIRKSSGGEEAKGYGRGDNNMVVHHHRLDPEGMEALREQRTREAIEALGTAAGDYSPDDLRRDSGGKRVRSKERKRGSRSRSSGGGYGGVERLREGCSELDWHGYHFPNCNEIHEIDLRGAVRRDSYVDEDAISRNDLPWGFVGNGLWRDVFSCDPRGEADDASSSRTPHRPPAVLKVMKSEHPYDHRNFERHRRDALVMERLSSSHHLVSIYGYCANTVLTEAISHTLDDVIYARENEEVKRWSPRSGYVTKPPLESWMGKDEHGTPLATRETELGRIRLALGVFRGLVDLHEGVGASGDNIEWLPIVHADLQAKQYLVDSLTGKIYLNDFNRCRFLTKLNSTVSDGNDAGGPRSRTLESCPLYIPTAPGSARAPEEYDMAPLSEKIDVYSAGNILYGIITGLRPWSDERGKHIRAAIQMGERPLVNDTIRNAVGTVDAELTRLLDRVYEHDPNKRASAREIVGELESLLTTELRRETPSKGAEDKAYSKARKDHREKENLIKTTRI
ncbi:hypothetical protein ACHAXA_010771 [Cyclostephanos tholiformis]|uniref:Protein kinase domain-containing protein n=1 Tax=Cyclostephanos tholiformis TaxID=382380 RepID=A0ABD3R4Q7_9STRA